MLQLLHLLLSFPHFSLKKKKPTEIQRVFFFCGAQNKGIFYIVKRLNTDGY